MRWEKVAKAKDSLKPVQITNERMICGEEKKEF